MPASDATPRQLKMLPVNCISVKELEKQYLREKLRRAGKPGPNVVVQGELDEVNPPFHELVDSAQNDGALIHPTQRTHFPMVVLPPQLKIVTGLDMVIVSGEELLLIATVPPFTTALTPSASVLNGERKSPDSPPL